MTMKISRRGLLKSSPFVLGAPLFLIESLRAAEEITLDDPLAKTFNYAPDVSAVDASKFPMLTDKSKQNCATCQLYMGKPGEAKGPCTLFQNKLVAAKGWCTAWVKKAG